MQTLALLAQTTGVSTPTSMGLLIMVGGALIAAIVPIAIVKIERFHNWEYVSEQQYKKTVSGTGITLAFIALIAGVALVFLGSSI